MSRHDTLAIRAFAYRLAILQVRGVFVLDPFGMLTEFEIAGFGV